jgi:hypothetical protein
VELVLLYIDDTIEVFSENFRRLRRIFGQEIAPKPIRDEKQNLKALLKSCSEKSMRRFASLLSWPSVES